MNTTQLEYFVSVAELHSFTKAAQKHYVSQTAVTQQIQNLEEILNTTLFDRTKRPIQLTDEGTMLLTDAKAILERMYGAVAKLSNVSSSVGGSLRIGYTKGYERSSLSAMLRRYHRDYPNVFLSCCRHNSKELTEALLSGALDMIFTWDHDPIMAMPQIEYVEVEHSSLDVVLYNAHPLVYRSFLRREDLREEKFIYLTPSGTICDDSYIRLYQEAGYEPNIIYYTDDIDSILMMVAAEEGISVMPTYMTRKLYHTEGIVCVPLRGEQECAAILAVWKADRANQRLQEFKEYLHR